MGTQHLMREWHHNAEQAAEHYKGAGAGDANEIDAHIPESGFPVISFDTADGTAGQIRLPRPTALGVFLLLNMTDRTGADFVVKQVSDDVFTGTGGEDAMTFDAAGEWALLVSTKYVSAGSDVYRWQYVNGIPTPA